MFGVIYHGVQCMWMVSSMRWLKKNNEERRDPNTKKRNVRCNDTHSG